ncbi:MAG: 3',5'-cyclic-AMP phosphodiesterase [Blastocatellia bacterium]|nr:3',5'-cyclic-AMP phosphodiesterase [Blastocatellia bacterium]
MISHDSRNPRPDQPDRVRILQFTDTHLLAREDGRLLGMNTLQSFQSVLELAQKHPWIPDVVLATGDLTQDHTPTAYGRVREQFQTFSQNVGKSDLQVYWLAGNHDDMSVMLEHLPGGPMQSFHSFQCGNWNVILLDTSIPGQVEGKLEPAELARLDETLAAFPHHHALVCTHHNPLPTHNEWMGEIGLLNATDYFSVLDRHPQVRISLCGHVHQEFRQVRKDVTFISSPSTCFQFKPHTIKFAIDEIGPGYRWFELMDDGTFATGVLRAEFKNWDYKPSPGGY